MRLPFNLAMMGVLLFAVAPFVLAEDGPDLAKESDQDPTGQLPNIISQSLGGVQLWSDELVFRGWRIQCHAMTNHYRLLDDQGYRRAWGSYDDCLARFETLKQQQQLQPIRGKVVITLHGLARPSSVMEDLDAFLAEKGDYTPINVVYASTRRTFDDHARSLERVIDHLPDADQIDFVCHSMGNMVVRRYLSICEQSPSGVDERFGRMVMLAPPNQGAGLAKQFRENKLLGLFLGPSAKHLARDWQTCSEQFAAPPFEFGIIAGTQSINPLISKTNDIFVSVEETKLAGARDFVTLPLWHGQLMNDPQSRTYILNFLDHGYFVSPEERHPLPALTSKGMP